MQLDPVELGRLAILMSSPLRYIERRVETLNLADDYHLEANVTQQFAVPKHTRKKSEGNTTNLLVPLGWYPKDRLPDLTVLAADGSMLPLLRRRDQGRIAATLFTVKWHGTFIDHLSADAKSETRIIWDIVKTAVEQVVTSSRLGANLVIYRLKRYLEELSGTSNGHEVKCFLLAVVASKEFWEHLQVLAGVRLLVAQMRGTPGRTYIVTIKYTERFEYRSYSQDGVGWRMLEWLGLVYIPIRRSAANIGHAASLWIVYSTPNGIEPLRCFWLSQAHESAREQDVTVATNKLAVGKHLESRKGLEPDSVDLDVQMEGNSGVATTGALAAILYLISVFVFKAGQHGIVAGDVIPVVGLFAAAPAAVGGALAFRSDPFARYVNRGPRALLAGLSGLGAVFAVVVGLHGIHGFAKPLAYVVSVYSLAVAGIFMLVLWAPRWRRNERSRRIRKTERTAPHECRRLQGRDGLIFLAIWAVVVLGVARAEFALQHTHVFKAGFPGDVLHAWVKTFQP